MRILLSKKCFLWVTFFVILTSYSQNKEAKLVLIQNDKFESLLDEKRKLNPTIATNDCYSIQIFSGEGEKAKKMASLFKQDFSTIDVTIVFNTPNYKVWVGNFKTRIEAERNLAEIEKTYKNCLLIKPGK